MVLISQDDRPQDDDAVMEHELGELAPDDAINNDDSSNAKKSTQEKVVMLAEKFKDKLKSPKNTIIFVSLIAFVILVLFKLIFSSGSGKVNRFDASPSAKASDADAEGAENEEGDSDFMAGGAAMGRGKPKDSDSEEELEVASDGIDDVGEEGELLKKSAEDEKNDQFKNTMALKIPELPELKVDIKPKIKSLDTEKSDDEDKGIIDVSKINLLSLTEKKEIELAKIEEEKKKEIERKAMEEMELLRKKKEEMANSFDSKPDFMERELKEADSKASEPQFKKIRKRNRKEKLLPIFELSGSGPEAMRMQETEEKRRRKNNSEISDFIFIDSYLNTEIDDTAIETKRIKGLSNVIAQGRMIEAVLETAINSELPGTVRALVTRNIYGEITRNVLIPRGTRLYGSYSNTASSGGSISKSRILITWSRMIRPDGVSVNINSVAVDQFGRTGIAGKVDNRVVETVSSSVLLSLIPLATAVAVSSLAGTSNTQTTSLTNNANSVTMLNNNPVNVAVQSFTKQVGDTTQDVIKNLINTTPTITLNQGTRIKIIVNQDIRLSTYKKVTKSSSSIG